MPKESKMQKELIEKEIEHKKSLIKELEKDTSNSLVLNLFKKELMKLEEAYESIKENEVIKEHSDDLQKSAEDTLSGKDYEKSLIERLNNYKKDYDILMDTVESLKQKPETEGALLGIYAEMSKVSKKIVKLQRELNTLNKFRDMTKQETISTPLTIENIKLTKEFMAEIEKDTKWSVKNRTAEVKEVSDSIVQNKKNEIKDMINSIIEDDNVKTR